MLANIPATQTVIEIRKPGGPEVLVPATRPVPGAEARRGVDPHRRRRHKPRRLPAAHGPLSDAARGARHSRPRMFRHHRQARRRRRPSGRRATQVCALMIGDGYGEYAAVPAVQCLPTPAGVSLIDAGGLPETFCTVWTNVFDRMRLTAGEMFLLQGGSSGIGMTAIQLAKAFGAKVITTAGSDEKCRACRDYGADLAMNYKHRGFRRRGKAFTQRPRRRCDLRHGRRRLHRAPDRSAGARGPAVLRRADAGQQGGGGFRRGPAQAPDVTGSTLRPRSGRAEGGDHRDVAGEGMAAMGSREIAHLHLSALPAGASRRGASR